MSDYVLGHSRPEIDRLQRQAEMLRPITERLLVAAGVEPGMRVLDIGCGPGDVSTLIADLVGPTGSVVGIDPSAEALPLPANGSVSVTTSGSSSRTSTAMPVLRISTPQCAATC